MSQPASPETLITDPAGLPLVTASAAPVRWVPDRAAPATPWNRPGTVVAMRRGMAGRCPACGQTRLFQGWLRQTEICAACHAPLGRIRADDAPPYFVIFIVAHLVIGTQLALDSTLALSAFAEAAIFLPITLAAALLLLRPVKGATIGLMLQLGMDTPPAVLPARALPNSAADNG